MPNDTPNLKEQTIFLTDALRDDLIKPGTRVKFNFSLPIGTVEAKCLGKTKVLMPNNEQHEIHLYVHRNSALTNSFSQGHKKSFPQNPLPAYPYFFSWTTKVNGHLQVNGSQLITINTEKTGDDECLLCETSQSPLKTVGTIWGVVKLCEKCESSFHICPQCERKSPALLRMRISDDDRDSFICPDCAFIHGQYCQHCASLILLDSGLGSHCEACQGRPFLCNTCDEEHRNSVHMQHYHPLFKNPCANTKLKTLPIKRKYGLELETSMRTSRRPLYFRKVTDGSIGGYEFVSPKLSGDKGLAVVRRELRHCIAECKTDSKCGFHLHVDATDLKWGQLRNILYLYKHLEPLIYSIVTPDRLRGRWCIPLECSKSSIETIKCENDLKTTFYGTLVTDRNLKCKGSGISNKEGNDRRYTGLNLHAYYYQGSIELRYHHGTVAFGEIRNWIFINLALIEFAAVHSFEDIKKFCQKHPITTLGLIALKFYPKQTTRRLLEYVKGKIRKYAT
jgi:hypothetical protein